MNEQAREIKVRQYVVNEKGRKVAAILGIKECRRIEALLEDLDDLKTIDNRRSEVGEEYESYRAKRIHP
jgi:hypothetical protein